MEKKLIDSLFAALVEKEAQEDEPPFYTMLRNMYKSCMNLSKYPKLSDFLPGTAQNNLLITIIHPNYLAEIEKSGNEPVLQVLKELGGWPVLDGESWNVDRFDWLDTLERFRKAGFSHDIIIDLSVTPDYRNNTRHVIDVSHLCGQIRGFGPQTSCLTIF